MSSISLLLLLYGFDVSLKSLLNFRDDDGTHGVGVHYFLIVLCFFSDISIRALLLIVVSTAGGSGPDSEIN